jgi:hypothetical protein
MQASSRNRRRGQQAVLLMTIRLTATLGLSAQTTTGGACIYVVSPSASKALSMSGGTFASSCGIEVDSTQSNALDITGGSMFLAGGAGISVAGQSADGTQDITFTGGGSLQTRHTVHGDPIAGYVTAPTPAGPCIPDPNYKSGMNNITIPSGTYCSLSLTGGTGLVLSGTYIITRGSFKVTAGSVTTADGGALIYFPSSSTGGLDITGGAVTLSGLTSTTNSGLAVWQDNSVQATVTGNKTAINGVIYVPHSLLNYTGGSTGVSQTIVANTLKLTGGIIANPAVSSLCSSGGATMGGN